MIDLSDVPAAAKVNFSFNYWLQTENYLDYDTAEVRISSNGTDFFYLTQLWDTTGWSSCEIQLGSEYYGGYIWLQFVFDSVDGLYNNYEGWYIDDILIQAEIPSIDPQLCLTGTHEGDRLGASVSAFGNLDSNQTREFAILGAGTDTVYIIPGDDTTTGTISEVQDQIQLTRGDGGSLADYLLKPAGDVNGDTVSDLLITGSNDSFLVFGDDWESDQTLTGENGVAVQISGRGDLLPLGDINGDTKADLAGVWVEQTHDPLNQGSIVAHLVGHVFLGRENDPLNDSPDPDSSLGANTPARYQTPDLVIETGQPFYVTEPASPPAQPFFFAGLGNIDGAGPDDFAIADSVTGNQLHVFCGQPLQGQTRTQRAGGRGHSLPVRVGHALDSDCQRNGAWCGPAGPGHLPRSPCGRTGRHARQRAAGGSAKRR